MILHSFVCFCHLVWFGVCTGSQENCSAQHTGTEYPKIVLESVEPLLGRLGFSNSTSIFVDKVVRGSNTVKLTCSAPYPVRFNYHVHSAGKDSRAKWDGEWMQTFYDDFWNNSTYIFEMRMTLVFVRVTQPELFTCLSFTDPCVGKHVLYTWNETTNQLGFSLHEDLLDKTQVSTINNNDDGTDCDAHFYYRRIQHEGMSTYEVACKLPNGIGGGLKSYECTSSVRCDAFFHGGRKKLGKSCWSNWKTPKDCPNCLTIEMARTINTIFICPTISSIDSSTVDTSSYATFAAFGIPLIPGHAPNIYFSREEIPVPELIQMKISDNIQEIGTSMEVECSASYYHFVGTIQFALEYSDRPGLTLFHDAQATRYVYEINSVRLNGMVKLDRVTLNRVYCFGNIQGSFNWLNVSKPVNVVVPQQPKVFIGLVMESPLSSPFNWEEEGAEKDNKEFNFEENAVGKSVICGAIGTPIPNITWQLFNRGYTPVETVTIINSTYKQNQLAFHKIHHSIGGTYKCEARNQYGTTSKQIFINIIPESTKSDSPVADKTNVIIVAVGSLLALLFISFGIVMGLLWRKTKLLAVHVRNLTDEEIRNFREGNANLDPYDIQTPIGNLPFNENYEIARELLELDDKCILGSGHYGVVKKGFIVREDGSRHLVAVKTIKKNADTDHFLALLSEIKIMAYLGGHEHVIRLLATCTENIQMREAHAAVEFCSKGDLYNYLKENKKSFINIFKEEETGLPASNIYENSRTRETSKSGLTTLDLIVMARDIASGMMYLTTKNVIHGDLATRNILLTDEIKVKISDFGLSRQLLGTSNYVKKSLAPIPWKWLSIEALTERTFSIKSDVWSYGVVLWEIFSLASDPYPGCRWNHDFINSIMTGYRMQKPPYADNTLYEMMTRCWHIQPAERPQFQQIHEELQERVSGFSHPAEENVVMGAEEE